MLRFAARTGLTNGHDAQRYLWTDAFAVCNFLALARATGEERYRGLALSLVDQVHQVLGRHRPDDRRRGWISGLDEPSGERHPTCGGLRIGKKLPERESGVPVDERLEWDRDGQYFHYLTKWMLALDQVAGATQEARFNTWARELAETAHRGFTSGPPGRERRMAWKMNIDLSRPAVTSMGQHDPLDGYLTCLQLEASASRLPDTPRDPDLKEALGDFQMLIEDRDWTTPDPLGLGGLLMDACRIAQLMSVGGFSGSELLDTLLGAVRDGLDVFLGRGELRKPASQRLAFRELGLALGISAIDWIDDELRAAPGRFPDRAALGARIEELRPYRPLAAAIRSFWHDTEHRNDVAWAEHRNINDVMLASCLVPETMLLRRSGGEARSL